MARSHTGSSDADLLSRTRAGDSDAFGVLWERHRLPGIVAARNIAPTLDADDLVSGAYLKIFELVRDGKGPKGAFRPYLYRVISTLATDTFRGPETAHVDLEAIPNLTEFGPWEDGAIDLNAAARAFESLPERWQAVLWYSTVENLPPREIAPLLGISANAVSALIVRATEGLQSAWVETHINMQLADDACRETREHLQRFQLGKLTARRSRDVQAHIDVCENCTLAARELTAWNSQLALILSTLLIGSASAGLVLKAVGGGVAAGAGGAAASAGGGWAAVATKLGKLGKNPAAGGAAASTTGIIAVTSVAAVTLAAVIGGGSFLMKQWGSGSNVSGDVTTVQVDATTADDQSSEQSPVDQGGADTGEGQSGSEGSTTITTTDEAASGPRLPSSPEKPTDPGSPVEPEGPGEPEEPEEPEGPGDPDPPVTPPATDHGFTCAVALTGTDEFQYTGQSVKAGVVQLRVSPPRGTQMFSVTTSADGSWASQPIAGLASLLDGTTSVSVRMQGGGGWQATTPTLCSDEGLVIDTTLAVTEACYLSPTNEPDSIFLSGRLSAYGVLFARLVHGGNVTQISDPTFDGVIDPTDPNVTWFDIFTGSDRDPDFDWWAPLDMSIFLGTVDQYNSGESGTLQLRVQTPDNRTSQWQPVSQLTECS